MKQAHLLIALLLFIAMNLTAQDRNNSFTVMFYNVENLFDTIDDPDFQDEEFTPGSEKQWNTQKYMKKLNDLAHVISAVPGKELPAIIGFAEVENKEVLVDLTEQKDLKKRDYEVVLIDGNDPRGIDCGMIYRSDLFKYSSHEMIPVEDLSGAAYPLRGILHISGKGPDDRNLHIYINHWKSRSGGVAETEHLRVSCASALRNELDRLSLSESDPRVLLMGDFNDEPTNHSISDVLGAGNKRKNPGQKDLYNLFYDIHNLDLGGSYCYRGNWETYDQIIVSYSLLNQASDLCTSFDGGNILKEDWMLYFDERNKQKIPNRTYGGNNYFGGISDHLPIYVSFNW